MPGQHWSTEECRLLTRLLRHGLLPSAISINGRPPCGVYRKAVRLRLWKPRGGWRFPWPPKAVRRLRSLVARGVGPVRITTEGLLNGYSATAVEKKLRRLGFKNPERRHRRRRNVRLTNRQRATLHTFLHEHVHEWTPEQLALEWNRRFRPKILRGKVVYHLTALGIKRPWSEVIRMPYAREKMRRSRLTSRNVREAQARRWNRYRLRLVASLRERARALTGAEAYGATPPTLRACADCGLPWPAREPFFRISRMQRRDGRVTRRLLPRCHLCENARRRALRRVHAPAALFASDPV